MSIDPEELASSTVQCMVCTNYTAITFFSDGCNRRHPVCPRCAVSMATSIVYACPSPQDINSDYRPVVALHWKKTHVCPSRCAGANDSFSFKGPSAHPQNMMANVAILESKGVGPFHWKVDQGKVTCEGCLARVPFSDICRHLFVECPMVSGVEVSGAADGFACPLCQSRIRLPPAEPILALEGLVETYRRRVGDAIRSHEFACTRLPCSFAGCPAVGDMSTMAKHWDAHRAMHRAGLDVQHASEVVRSRDSGRGKVGQLLEQIGKALQSQRSSDLAFLERMAELSQPESDEDARARSRPRNE